MSAIPPNERPPSLASMLHVVAQWLDIYDKVVARAASEGAFGDHSDAILETTGRREAQDDLRRLAIYFEMHPAIDWAIYGDVFTKRCRHDIEGPCAYCKECHDGDV